MTVAEQVAEKLKELPPDKQQEVLEFVDTISTELTSRPKLTNPEGLWAGRGCDISPEELAEARREMWGKFYDEDVY